MYSDDSFFTLSGPGQIGLVLLSLVLFVVVVCAMVRVGRVVPRTVALLLAIAGFWAFEWLSPQIYYSYYMTQFDGLPVQNVIQSPPSPAKLFNILTFQDEFTLSAHGRAVLGWALIIAALLSGKSRRSRVRRNQS